MQMRWKREMMKAFNMLNGRMVGQAEDEVALTDWLVGFISS